jgi:hypothetical protein
MPLRTRLGQSALASVMIVVQFAMSARPAFSQDKPPDRKPAAVETPATTTPPASAVTLDQVLQSLDKDSDGRISRSEATGQFAQRFSSWDANSDGFATREEIQAFRKQRGLNDDGSRTAPVTGSSPATPPNANQRSRSAANKILTEPADWREEQFSIPPGFAPEITWKGSEECRFSPGMYDTKSREYFTYAVALTLEGSPEIGPAELKQFLELYFRGLSGIRARRTGSSPDGSKMLATVSSAPGSPNKLLAEMTFIDSFTDGREVKLLIEADVVRRPAAKSTCVLLLISPSARDSETWKSLRSIGEKALKRIP